MPRADKMTRRKRNEFQKSLAPLPDHRSGKGALPYPGYAGLHRRCGHGGFSCGGVWIVLRLMGALVCGGGVFLSALPARGRWPPGCQYRGRQALALISLLACSGAAPGWLTGITGRRLFQLPAPPPPASPPPSTATGGILARSRPFGTNPPAIPAACLPPVFAHRPPRAP